MTDDCLVVAAAVVERDGRFLVTRRPNGVHLGISGRQVPPGESLDDVCAASCRKSSTSTPATLASGGAARVTHAYPDRASNCISSRCELRRRAAAAARSGDAMGRARRLAPSVPRPPTPSSHRFKACLSLRYERQTSRTLDDAENSKRSPLGLPAGRRTAAPRPRRRRRQPSPSCPARRSRGGRNRARSAAAAPATRALLVTSPISPIAGANARAGRRRHVTRRRAVRRACAPRGRAPVQHADDDLLADVASLAETDRARLDARFERNRLLVHVTMKDGHARLDPHRLGGVGIDLGGAGFDRARRSNALRRRALRRTGRIPARPCRRCASRSPDRRSTTRPEIAVHGQRVERLGRARRARARRARRLRADDRHLRERVRDVAELHVLGK